MPASEAYEATVGVFFLNVEVSIADVKVKSIGSDYTVFTFVDVFVERDVEVEVTVRVCVLIDKYEEQYDVAWDWMFLLVM